MTSLTRWAALLVRTSQKEPYALHDFRAADPQSH
jgi:hypothetical protein